MAVDFSYMVTNNTPVDKRTIRGWLDLMGYGYAFDETHKTLYYQGVMGNKPLYVLSYMVPMPTGTMDPLGYPYRGDVDYKISLRFEGKYYQARYRVPESELGQKSIQDGNKTKRLYYGYMLTGVFGPLEDSEAEHSYLSAALH